jgi:hypothetical protein
LAKGLLLALAVLPVGSAMAEVLDGEKLVLNPTASVRDWTLRNGAQLIVNGATTHWIEASQDSRVQLQGATVQWRQGAHRQDAVRLFGTSVLEANSSTIRGAGVELSESSSANLVDSAILVTRAAGMDTAGLSVGVDLYPSGTVFGDARITLDSTQVRVEDSNGGLNSGLGVRMGLADRRRQHWRAALCLAAGLRPAAPAHRQCHRAVRPGRRDKRGVHAWS